MPPPNKQGVLDKFFLKKRDESQKMDEQSTLHDEAVCPDGCSNIDYGPGGARCLDCGAWLNDDEIEADCTESSSRHVEKKSKVEVTTLDPMQDISRLTVVRLHALARITCV